MSQEAVIYVNGIEILNPEVINNNDMLAFTLAGFYDKINLT